MSVVGNSDGDIPDRLDDPVQRLGIEEQVGDDSLEETTDDLDTRTDDTEQDGLGVGQLGQAENDEDEQPDSGPETDLFNSAIKPKNSGTTTMRKPLMYMGFSGLVLSVMIGFLMYMTLYRSEHVRNLLWDYRFARFHRQIGKRIQANMMTIEGISPTSTEKVIRFEKTSMYKKVMGYTPEKAFQALGDGGIKVGVEKTGVVGFRKESIVSFTDPATGKTAYSNRAANIPAGAEVLNTAEFADRLGGSSLQALDRTNHSKFFQRQTRRMLRDKVNIKFGDRFKNYQQKKSATLKGEEREATPDEKTRALREADLDTARGSRAPPTASGSLEEASNAAKEDVLDGTPEPSAADLTEGNPKPKSKTVQKLSAGASVYSEFSTLVFAVTMGCIVRDLSSSMNDALAGRIENPMRAAAGIMGEAEQLKNNSNVDLEAVGLRNEQLSSVEQSAAFRKINNDNVDNIPETVELPTDELPFEVFGMSISTLSSFSGIVDGLLTKIATQLTIPIPGIFLIPGTDKIGEGTLNTLCKQALNPTAQAVIAVADVAFLIGSLGATGAVEGSVKAFTVGMQQAVKIGGAVGLTKIMFEYAIPKFLFAMAGSGGILGVDDPQNGNKLDVGTTLLAAQTGQFGGASPISLDQAARDQEEAIAYVKKQRVLEDGWWAYIDPSSPYSLTGQLAMSLPGSPKDVPMAFAQKTIGSTLSLGPIKHLSTMFSPKAQAQSASYETYGVTQVGIPDQYLDLDMIDIALEVEGDDGSKLAQTIADYGFCYTDTVAQQAISSGFSGKDYSKCSDDMAIKLGIYNIDSCGMVLLSDSTDTANCSVFSGAGDVAYGDEDMQNDYSAEYTSSETTSIEPQAPELSTSPITKQDTSSRVTTGLFSKLLGSVIMPGKEVLVG